MLKRLFAVRANMNTKKSDDPLRIVLSHVYSWPEVRRGGERYLHEVASALTLAGHQVTILSTGLHRERTNIQDVPVERLRRRFLPERFFGAQSDEVAFGLQALSWVARRPVDVWHALGTADAASATLFARPKKFRSVHTSLGLPEKGYWNNRPDRILHEFVAARIDSYICLSQASAAGLRAGWSRSAEVVSGGVDIDRFTPSARRHDRPALLYSGTLTEERKNLRLLLEAVAILRAKHPQLELWLSGPGDPSSLIAASPPSAKDAVMHLGLGSPDEQGLRYGRAWATVLPSKHEAFGLCLIESLACGTPIVALEDGGGPAELIQPGIGVASGSTSTELAEACGQAIELAQLHGTAEGCRAASERYDWRRSIVPRLEEIYRRHAPRS